MYTIGVISDTHARTIHDIPARVLKALSETDLIVHAGDFTHMAVLDGLRAIGEVKAVAGNMDSILLKTRLPQKELFEVAGRTVGLTHSSGGPRGMADRIRDMFTDVDLIIYGHSHEPWNETNRGTLMFNPGRGRYSFGLITIEDEIKAEIIAI